MSNLNGRVDKLEQRAGLDPELPWLSLQQSLDDDAVWVKPGRAWKGEAEERYTTAELDELSTRFRLILIAWANEWPPGGQLPGNRINIQWPDD